MSVVKRWNGSTWVDVDSKPWKRWSGASWVDISTKTRYRWNGTSWVEIGGGASTPPTPTFAGSSSAAGSSLNATCALPSGWTAGQLAIFAATINTTGGTLTPPSGWTALPGSPSMPVVLSSSCHWIGYRTLQAGDAAPVFSGTGGLPKFAAGIVTYDDAEFDVEAHASESVNQTTHAAPTVNTLGDNRRIVRVYTHKGTTNTGWTDPGSTTRRLQQLGTGSGASDLLVVDSELVTAGATGTATATASVGSAQVEMATIALKGV